MLLLNSNSKYFDYRIGIGGNFLFLYLNNTFISNLKLHQSNFFWCLFRKCQYRLARIGCDMYIVIQGVSSGFDTMYLALADINMQVRFGLKVVWES
jgi:hypothetical protein